MKVYKDIYIYEARSKLVAQAWFEMHDYRSLGGGLSFLKVLLKLSGSPGNKLLYVLLYNPASEMDPKHSELWAPDHLQAFFSKLIIVLLSFRLSFGGRRRLHF